MEPENEVGVSRVDHFHHSEEQVLTLDYEITKYAKGGFGYTVKVRNVLSIEDSLKKLRELTAVLEREYPSSP